LLDTLVAANPAIRIDTHIDTHDVMASFLQDAP
jgi:hypothetical protein